MCLWLVMKIFFGFNLICAFHALSVDSRYFSAFLGRIMQKRSSGAKLVFYDLHGGGLKVQVMADARYITFSPLFKIKDIGK